MTRRALPRAVLLLAAVATRILAQPVPTTIPIPDGDKGVGFDDLRYSPTLGRVLVPAANTGALVLVEPGDWRITHIGSLAEAKAYGGGHDDGITSADEGGGYVFLTDRTAQMLLVVDPKNGRVATSAPLAGGPDYVRYVEPTREVWVTEPDKDRIEIFRLEGNPPKPVHDDFLEVKGGPESLVVDGPRNRAYTNLWKGSTLAINVKNRGTVAKWDNGCDGSRGLAIDPERGFVFVGCAEGKGVTLDAKSGRVLGRVTAPNGVDIIDYSPSLSHLYLPGGKRGTMVIAEVSSTGGLSAIAEVPTAGGAHCVVADASRNVYVCDPKGGRLLVIRDE